MNKQIFIEITKSTDWTNVDLTSVKLIKTLNSYRILEMIANHKCKKRDISSFMRG